MQLPHHKPQMPLRAGQHYNDRDYKGQRVIAVAYREGGDPGDRAVDAPSDRDEAAGRQVGASAGGRLNLGVEAQDEGGGSARAAGGTTWANTEF